jgi:Na+/proline symporter
VIVTDFLQRLGPPRDDAYWLRRAKVITAIAGGVAVILACLLAVTPMESAFDFFQRLLGLTSSGLAGLFILGIFTRRTCTAGALTGAVTSALVLYLVQTQTKLHVYLYALTGIGVCVIVGYTVSLLLNAVRPLPAAANR